MVTYLARARGPQFLVGFSWKRVSPEALLAALAKGCLIKLITLACGLAKIFIAAGFSLFFIGFLLIHSLKISQMSSTGALVLTAVGDVCDIDTLNPAFRIAEWKSRRGGTIHFKNDEIVGNE